jgi:chromate transporter
MILLKFCGVLFMVNALTIGGGFAMLPLLHKEFVERYHWLTNQEFIDAFAVGQITPGPLTVMNAFIGFKLHGLSGAILAVVSSYLPGIIIVTLTAKYYYAYRESTIVTSAFKGIKPAVIGLLAAVAVSLGTTSLVDAGTLVIALASFTIITFTKIDPTFIILGAGLIGAVLF